LRVDDFNNLILFPILAKSTARYFHNLDVIILNLISALLAISVRNRLFKTRLNHDRQTDQQASRRTDRRTNRRLYGETKVGETNSQIDVLRKRQKDGKTERYMERQTGRSINKQMGKQLNWTNGQTDR
jgi:hypothetical protein